MVTRWFEIGIAFYSGLPTTGFVQPNSYVTQCIGDCREETRFTGYILLNTAESHPDLCDTRTDVVGEDRGWVLQQLALKFPPYSFVHAYIL